MSLITSGRRLRSFLKSTKGKRQKLRRLRRSVELRQTGEPPCWFVYVLLSDVRFKSYVGVTIDVDRRVLQHNGKVKGGARSTRSGRPWRIGKIYGPYGNRSDAQIVEAKVKRLRGYKRLHWSGLNPVRRNSGLHPLKGNS